MADHMNKFFCTVGSRVSATITTNYTLEDFPYASRPPVFDFSPVTETDTASAIDSLSNSAACSLDEITSLVLKSAKTELLPVLTHLYNLSIRTHVFPKCWKVSKVTPLFKSGNRNHVNNYWPISIIPTVGKVMERLVHTQLSKYLKVHQILNESQSGFRQAHSTGTCLVDFLDSIYEEIDGGGIVGSVYLDLSKAFDSIHHNILIVKLQKLGIRLGSCAWVESYLCDRTQHTKVNNTLSGPLTNECGVPQGSILGPLLFICYVNDLSIHLNHTDAFMYADDTAIIARGKSHDSVHYSLQHDLNILKNWFDANRLCLNVDKTKSMIFSSKRNWNKDIILNLEVNHNAIEQVQHFKYLGVEVDKHLSFNQHVDRICKKVNRGTGLLWRMRSFISQDLAKYLYKSLIEPHFTYLEYVYDACPASSSHKLQIAQNGALRAILNVDSRCSTAILHEKTGIPLLSVNRKKIFHWWYTLNFASSYS